MPFNSKLHSDAVASSREQRLVVADQPHWYAVYTWARHEKKVARHFEERGIVHFLPLYTATHVWNKKTAKVALPLFPGYVFVQASRQHRHYPLTVPGVVHFVGNSNSPAEIPAEEMEFLREAVRMRRKIEPHPYLAPGNRVRITSGPLSGISGVIQRTSAGCRIVISVDTVMRSVAVEVDASSLIAA
jgi:transcription antitermination factor NusG